MPALAFQSHQRRQALSIDREAAEWDSCGGRINPTPPRTPRSQRLRPGWGNFPAKRGGAIAFIKMGRQGERRKPVDSVGCNYVTPHSTKRCGRFARMNLPHFALFYPRFTLFLPHPPFLKNLPIYLSIYLFSEERERKEGGWTGKRQSTSHPRRNKMCPRIFNPIHGFSWMVKRLETQCWRGFAGFSGSIHTSTGGNALGTFLRSRHGH